MDDFNRLIINTYSLTSGDGRFGLFFDSIVRFFYNKCYISFSFVYSKRIINLIIY